MSKFQVGDRVAVYGFMYPVVRITGTVTNIHSVVVFDPDPKWAEQYGKSCSANIKQCRKLRKVAKPRKLWVSWRDMEKYATSIMIDAYTSKPSCEHVEFVEVRKPKS